MDNPAQPSGVSSNAPSAATRYRRLGQRRAALLTVAAALLLASLLADLMTGPAMLSISEVASAFLHPAQADAATRTILWTLRMPAALLAVAIGASLGVAGAQMQTILDNPLASPYTLGVSAAASFGASLALVCGAGASLVASNLVVPLSAFVFAMLCSLAIYGVARMRRASAETIILSGVALLFLFNSAVAFMQYEASENQLQAIVFWMFGSLQGANWNNVTVVSCVLLATVALLSSQAWKLTALRLGESHARSLGIDVPRLRLRTLLLVSVLTATAVCFAGAIGFIGLVAPHLARIFVGEDQRYYMPFSALCGGLLLSAAAIASKMIHPGVVFPIGIATALLGVPFFGAMILTKKRSSW